MKYLFSFIFLLIFTGCVTGRPAVEISYSDTMYTAISVYEEEFGELSKEAYECVESFVVVEKDKILQCGTRTDDALTGCALCKKRILYIETKGRPRNLILCTAVHEYLHAIEACRFGKTQQHKFKKVWDKKDKNSVLSKGCAVYKDFK